MAAPRPKSTNQKAHLRTRQSNQRKEIEGGPWLSNKEISKTSQNTLKIHDGGPRPKSNNHKAHLRMRQYNPQKEIEGGSWSSNKVISPFFSTRRFPSGIYETFSKRICSRRGRHDGIILSCLLAAIPNLLWHDLPAKRIDYIRLRWCCFC